MPALVFDSENRELRFVSPWFAAQPSAANTIAWSVKNGSNVAGGDVIGTLSWDNGTQEPLIAPAGCSGTVEASNRRIDYALLDKRPAQWAIRFALP